MPSLRRSAAPHRAVSIERSLNAMPSLLITVTALVLAVLFGLLDFLVQTT